MKKLTVKEQIDYAKNYRQYDGITCKHVFIKEMNGLKIWACLAYSRPNEYNMMFSTIPWIDFVFTKGDICEYCGDELKQSDDLTIKDVKNFLNLTPSRFDEYINDLMSEYTVTLSTTDGQNTEE